MRFFYLPFFIALVGIVLWSASLGARIERGEHWSSFAQCISWMLIAALGASGILHEVAENAEEPDYVEDEDETDEDSTPN